ncbi:MAG TPA: CoA transferase [Acidimicrobiia bacterium]|nr:CoA transferase [Acidimicrobiia bacterium]
MTDDAAERGPLAGLRLVNTSSNLVGACVGMFFADYGAEVVLVEPPGGSPLRHHPAWPVWARGSSSIEADLHDAAGVDAVRVLAGAADALLDTSRPGVMDRLGLGYEQLAATNPGLVYATVSGFGRTGPLAALQGYEGVVMAKIGGYDQFSVLVDRPGPAYASVPYCSFSASQLAVQGILAALVERTRSGLGQQVDTTMVQAIAAHDVFNWMVRLVARRYADAFTEVAPVDPRTQIPNSWMSYALIVGLSSDGRWLQFSQATPKLFQAFLRAVGLDGPEWHEAWADDDLQRRGAFRDRALEAIRSRTYAEWTAVFDRDPDVFAELYRNGRELLDHPQLVWEQRVVDVERPGYGRVRQPAPVVKLDGTPGRADRPVPTLDEHGPALRAAAPEDAAAAPDNAGAVTDTRAGTDTASAGMPLEGVTILELGTFFAGPYGAAVLSDLGARVIKIEQHDGDPIRWQLPMPELGAIKVLQGKESVAVDINTPEGRDIALEIAKRVDIVLMTFRAGVAERVGLDEASIRAVNPNVVYHSAVGFGVDGPYAHRPAYAPTIGAGSGMARRNIGSAVPEGPGLTLDEIKGGANRLGAANLTLGHADGFSGLGVAVGLLLGLLTRERGRGAQGVQTTMLATLSHVLSDDMFEYDGRAPVPAPDHELHGLHALYRLYPAADGWVFLAAPSPREWDALVDGLDDDAVAADARFATSDERRGHDAELVAALTGAFARRDASEWEARLTARDVACVQVVAGPSHAVLMDDDGLGRAMGIVTEVDHQILDRHTRLTAPMSFSRSTTRAGPAPVIGQQTDAVLREFGYSDARVAELRERGVVK